MRPMSPIRELASCLADSRVSIADKLVKTCEAIADSITGDIRTNLWLFNQSLDSIECIASYSKAPNRGDVVGCQLAKEDQPNYFGAILTQEVIVAENARFNDLTCCLRENYLEPQDIYSLLDIVFKNKHQPYGIICCEGFAHAKIWQPDEIEAVRNIAKILSSFLPNAIQMRTVKV